MLLDIDTKSATENEVFNFTQ